MASRSGSDQTRDVVYDQSRPPADSPSDVREIKKGTQQNPNHVLSSTSSSKAHLYVDLATALNSPPGTFTRDQIFEIWCKHFPKSYDSEKETLHRFELFNYFLDNEIENKYSSSSSRNMPTLGEAICDGARPDEISSPYHDKTEVRKLTKTFTGENKEEARKLEERISRLEGKVKELEFFRLFVIGCCSLKYYFT